MKLRTYLDFVKIEHTLFALPFAYVGALLSGKQLDARVLILIFTAFTGLRTAAMSFNRVIDRDIDAKNPRTAIRHIPAGIISVREAYAIAIAALIVYFISAALLNKTALLLSPIPPLVAYIYPWLKRYTCLSHYVLGLNLALAPLGGFVAATDSIDFLGSGKAVLLLSVGVMFWVAGFDTIYALQDIEFDRREGLHSVPAHFGERIALAISKINHAIFFALTTAALKTCGFWTLSLPIAPLLIIEHAIVEFRRDRLEIAFFHVNAAISATLLAAIAAVYLKNIGVI